MLFTKNLLPVDISSEDSYYILQFVSLVSHRKKLSSPVLLLWTVFGADQCNSSSVPLLHIGVPRSKHPAPPFLLSFPRCHWKDWCMRRWLWLSDVSNTIFFPTQIFLLLCTPPGLPRLAWSLLKKASQQIHQRGRPKAFELIYMTLSLLCDASIDISFLLQYSGVYRLNSKRCPFDLSSHMKTGVIVQRLWRSEIIWGRIK